MTPDELPGYLTMLQGKVADAALPAAVNMAITYKRAVQRNLALTSHAPYTRTPSPPGAFPSYRTGNLRRHIVLSGSGGGGGVAYASVSADTIYAGVQEYGHRMFSHSWRVPMTWYMDGQWWSKHEVKVPARPYMRPTTAQVIADGSLGRAAMEAFEWTVW